MDSAAAKLRILFLCTGNSCRSQMAEGWTRALHPDTFDVRSAGLEIHGLNHRAVRVMAEAGVDISHHRCTHLDQLARTAFDWVITVCDDANETCPVFPGPVRRLHRSFDDPPRLARDAASEEEALVPFRRVRDEIRAYVAELPGLLRSLGEADAGA